MPYESEHQTRKRRIDARLMAMTPPWQIIRHQDGLDYARLHQVAVEEYPTDNGPADYALFIHGRLLGIIEAKKVALDPYNVLEQAKRYARGVRDGAGCWDEYGVPFLYASNGETIWSIDVRGDRPRTARIASLRSGADCPAGCANGSIAPPPSRSCPLSLNPSSLPPGTNKRLTFPPKYAIMTP